MPIEVEQVVPDARAGRQAVASIREESYALWNGAKIDAQKKYIERRAFVVVLKD